MSQTQFIETDCIIEHEGEKFESGGAFIAKRRDNGLLGGILYAYPKTQELGDWHGTFKVKADFGHEWQSNMGDKRQHIRFTLEGKRFSGIWYNKYWSDMVKVREIKT